MHLLLRAMIQRAQNENDHRGIYTEFIKYYRFEGTPPSDARPNSAEVKDGFLEAADLIQEVIDNRARLRYKRIHLGQPPPPAMFHVNNNPCLCGPNMFEVLFRVRVETAKLEKADPTLLTFLQFISMITRMYDEFEWEDAEVAITLLGSDKVFGPGGRPTT
jgi:hypothetical protein